MPQPEPSLATSIASVQATFCATLVDQWIRDGLQHVVISPGSRSTPMALALTARPELEVQVFHDERSAGFAALGAGIASGRPAIVLCTSGTAATHLHGAVVEAHLSNVAMIVLTADRPPELRDVGAAQTIDQVKLYGASVRWFHDPGVPSPDAVSTWRSLARHAVTAATSARPGPVHLNLPFREPLVGPVGEMPPDRLGPIVRSAVSLRLGTLSMAVEREAGVIVAGGGVDDPAAVEALAAATGWPILADPRSGCRGLPHAVAGFDALLRHEDFADAHLPEVVVHLGEPPASKVLGQWLAGADAVQVRVVPSDRVIDPTSTVTHTVVAPIGEVCRRLAGELRGSTGSTWSSRWLAAGAIVERSIVASLREEASIVEPAVARVLSEFDGQVVAASSMPIRDLEWFGAPSQTATVVSNRGANGIDGTIATAIGLAAVSGRPVAVLIGDVALLHDSSSLTALRHRRVDVRIVVVDNDGGGIFSFLPQAALLDEGRFESLFGTPHGTDLAMLGAAHGLPVTVVGSVDELRSAIAELGSRLVVVRTGRSENVAVHARFNAAVIAALDDR